MARRSSSGSNGSDHGGGNGYPKGVKGGGKGGIKGGSGKSSSKMPTAAHAGKAKSKTPRKKPPPKQQQNKGVQSLFGSIFVGNGKGGSAGTGSSKGKSNGSGSGKKSNKRTIEQQQQQKQKQQQQQPKKAYDKFGFAVESRGDQPHRNYNNRGMNTAAARWNPSNNNSNQYNGNGSGINKSNNKYTRKQPVYQAPKPYKPAFQLQLPPANNPNTNTNSSSHKRFQHLNANNDPSGPCWMWGAVTTTPKAPTPAPTAPAPTPAPTAATVTTSKPPPKPTHKERKQAKDAKKEANQQAKEARQQAREAKLAKQQQVRQAVDDYSTSFLDSLNQELVQLAAYVQLSEVETAVRNSAIQDVSGMSIQCFGNVAETVTFGSFAGNRAVCTWQSDVDLAIWGAVESGSSPIRSIASPAAIKSPVAAGAIAAAVAVSSPAAATIRSAAAADAAVTQPLAAARSVPAVRVKEQSKKKALIRKWEQALAAVEIDGGDDDIVIDLDGNDDDDDDAKTVSTSTSGTAVDDDDDVYAEPLAKKVKRSTDGNTEASTTDDQLFVIDRVGNEDDDNGKISSTSAAEKQKDLVVGDGSTTETAISISNAGSTHDSTAPSENSSATDDDSADKLERLDDNAPKVGTSTRNPPVINLLSSSASESSESEYEFETDNYTVPEDSEPEVSFVARAGRQSTSPAGGMPRRIRHQVVDALVALSRKLRRTEWTRSVQVIKNARVPIIKLETALGFEADIAIGGHNGTDTSQYAAAQVARYSSFATVILVLKVLLAQQDLDKPFTGGLGSYKLYVLLAHHLQEHLALGGLDRPAEVLVSFLFRYGCVKGHNVDERVRTSLSQDVALEDKNGCVADLSNVFLLTHCVDLFKNCWMRLWKLARRFEDKEVDESLLTHLVDPSRLHRERQQCLRTAEKSAGKLRRPATNGTAQALGNTRKSSPAPQKSPAPQNSVALEPQEASAEQLMASYGVHKDDFS